MPSITLHSIHLFDLIHPIDLLLSFDPSNSTTGIQTQVGYNFTASFNLPPEGSA